MAPTAVGAGPGGARYGATQESAPSAQAPAVPPAGALPLDPDGPEGPVVAGARARLVDGVAHAPADAPPAVQQAVWAGNELQDKPYRYGGGHASFQSSGYDCSGTISYVLNAAGLLRRARDSSGFMRYGAAGAGRWLTLYSHRGHAYIVIAGLRLDTSAAGASGGRGPRWRDRGRPTRGFKVRHPVGL